LVADKLEKVRSRDLIHQIWFGKYNATAGGVNGKRREKRISLQPSRRNLKEKWHAETRMAAAVGIDPDRIAERMAGKLTCPPDAFHGSLGRPFRLRDVQAHPAGLFMDLVPKSPTLSRRHSFELVMERKLPTVDHIQQVIDAGAHRMPQNGLMAAPLPLLALNPYYMGR
jgi:hypothetical protein